MGNDSKLYDLSAFGLKKGADDSPFSPLFKKNEKAVGDTRVGDLVDGVTTDAFKTSKKGSLGSRHCFPVELPNLNRPIIEFRCLQAHSIISENTTIFLPAPEGLAYSNSSTYNDSELGILGNSVLTGINTIKNSKSIGEGISGLIADANSEWNNAKNTNILSAILAGASEKITDEGMKNAVRVAAGARFNPYVVTAFDGTNTREYSFEFKLIPSSYDEAQTIKNIVRIFQICVYGEVEGFLLKYPPKWKLSVLSSIIDNDGNKELKPISSFYECYLKDCNITYNSTENSYFKDDSPLETDISLTFVETKALHANQIAELLIGS